MERTGKRLTSLEAEFTAATDLTGADLSGAILFRATNLEKATLLEANLSRAIMPDGSIYTP